MKSSPHKQSSRALKTFLKLTGRQGTGAAILAAITALAGLPLAAFGMDLEQKVRFDIPAQDLGTALLQFSQQAHVQVIVSGEIRGEVTEGIRGEHAIKQALSKLLAPAGLRYEVASDTSITIGRADARADLNQHALWLAQADPSTSQQGGDGSQGTPSPSQGEGGDEDGKENTKQSGGNSDQEASMEKVSEEVVVTGTRIRGLAPKSSPLVIYDREYIEQSGVVSVEQLARILPQNLSSTNSETAGKTLNSPLSQRATAGIGQTGLNLHGLGPGATLVLLNGHRMAPAGTTGDFVDISSIPLSAIERVEVLTDGASALYGADAIAGVVNFVLRRNFEGAETSLRQQITTRGGGEHLDLSQLLGTAWSSGNGLVVYEFEKQNGLRSRERDFIPTASGPQYIMPVLETQSVFLTGRQDVRIGEISADIMYSDKEYLTDTALTAADITRAIGTYKQYGSTVNVTRKLLGDWRLELTGNYWRLQNDDEAYSVGPMSSNLINRGETDSRTFGFDLIADGTAFTLVDRSVKMAAGVGSRSERRANSISRLFDTELKRNVESFYGEIYVPVFQGSMRKRAANRLEISLAARYDRYDKIGSSTNPKYGVLWEPLSGVSLRSTYATSYRAPALEQLIYIPNYFVIELEDPAASDGLTLTLLNRSQDGTLKPEQSRTTTAGLDLKPTFLPPLSFSISYFRTVFTDRVGAPPISGGVQQIFFQEEILGPLIDRSPDSAELQHVFASGAVTNPAAAPSGASSIEAVVRAGLVNIAASEMSGVDSALSYSFQSPIGEVNTTLSGTYLLQLKHKTIAGTRQVSFLNTLGQPLDLRLRGAVAWSYAGFSSSLNVNYSDAYRNNLFTPSHSINSWITGDAFFSYQWDRSIDGGAPSILDGLKVGLSIQNFTDEDPPVVELPPQFAYFDIGYDVVNASATGRAVAVQLSKRW